MDHEIKLTTPGGDGATKHQKNKVGYIHNSSLTAGSSTIWLISSYPET